VYALRDAHKARRFVSWVRETYRSHRQPELGSAWESPSTSRPDWAQPGAPLGRAKKRRRWAWSL